MVCTQPEQRTNPRPDNKSAEVLYNGKYKQKIEYFVQTILFTNFYIFRPLLNSSEAERGTRKLEDLPKPNVLRR